jgi:hypothetical protein
MSAPHHPHVVNDQNLHLGALSMLVYGIIVLTVHALVFILLGVERELKDTCFAHEPLGCQNDDTAVYLCGYSEL